MAPATELTSVPGRQGMPQVNRYSLASCSLYESCFIGGPEIDGLMVGVA